MQKIPQNQEQQDSFRKRYCCWIIIAVLVVILIVLATFLSLLKNKPMVQSIKIVIAGSNDIHGHYYPQVFQYGSTNQTYQYGGMQVMSSLIQILKQKNPGHFLYLDAGDHFQGGIQSSSKVSSGKIMADYFNHVGLQASAVGNHQFDFGPEFLETYLEWLDSKILAANLIDEASEKKSPHRYPLFNQKRTKIFNFPVGSNTFQRYSDSQANPNDIKIGVIGLTTLETPRRTSGFTNQLFPKTYKFLDYVEVIQKESALLRKKGAHAILLLSHVGNQCGRSSKYGIWAEYKNRGSPNPCELNPQLNEIDGIIDSLQKDVIDAVIQGHRHSTAHYFRKGVAFMGNIDGGYYFNAMNLYFNIDRNYKVTFKKAQTQIEGPIPVCERIFSKSKTCEYMPEHMLESVGQLTQWQFHGTRVVKDANLAKFVQNNWGPTMGAFRTQVVKNLVPYPFGRNFTSGSPLGKLITNAIGESKQVDKQYDFIIINPGMFRENWYPGVIRESEFYGMMPYDCKLGFFSITGANLRKFMEHVQTTGDKYYPIRGLSVTIQVNTQNISGNSSLNLLNNFSQQSSNKQQDSLQSNKQKSSVPTRSSSDKLIDITFANGSPIIDDQVYRGVSTDFTIKGGDNFRQVKQLYTDVKITDQLVQDIIREKLKEWKQITQANFADPYNKERIVLV